MRALLWLALAAPAAAVPPKAPGGRVAEYETAARAFYKAGAFDLLGDLTLRSDRGEKLLTTGGYARLHRNLKVGAFYRLQQGMRQDDDWQRRALSSTQWEWKDARRRFEHVAIADVTPRFALGGPLVLFLKNQLHFNSYTRHSLYKAAPELACFFPRGVAYLRAEGDLALSRGAKELVDRWAYAGFLWRATEQISVGPHAALRDWVWRTSRHSPPADRYRVVHRSVVLGVTLLGRF